MTKNLDKSQSKAYATGQGAAADAHLKPKALIFSVHTEHQRGNFVVALHPQMIFGRSDNKEAVDIDLSSFGAFEKGVSRKHMMIVQQGHQLMVKDLHSSNGTRIGDELLTPDTFYKLSDKDTLQLGRLKLFVTFSYKSMQSTILPSLPPNSENSRTETIHHRRMLDNSDQ